MASNRDYKLSLAPKILKGLFLMIPLFYVIRASSTCSTKSPKCTCVQGRSNFSCIDAGVDFIDLGVDLKALDANITGNNLTNLDGNTFKLLTKVQYLYLRHNRIAKIQSTTFNNNHDLTSLDLTYNSITSLPDDLFAATRKLKFFYCPSNNLTSISSRLFEGLFQLRYIHLQGNQITKIDAKAFTDAMFLHSLYLHHNQLQTAYWKWIGHFNHTEASYEIYMEGNPWSCDCKMIDFMIQIKNHAWIKKKAREFGQCAPNNCKIDIPECYSPSNLKGKNLNQISNQQDMVCHGPVVIEDNNCSTSSNCSVHIDEGSPGAVHCSAIGLPVPLVKITDEKNKDLTKEKIGHVVLSFSSVTMEDAGKYYCIISGYNSEKVVTLNTTINLIVKSKTTITSIGVIQAVIISVILVVVGGLLYLRHRRNKRTSYSLLDKDPAVHYDLTAESMTTQSPKFESTISDDETIAYSTHDEKEVLV